MSGNSDVKKNLGASIFIFLLLLGYIFYISVKRDRVVDYEDIKVCGYFKKVDKLYFSRGSYNYQMEFISDDYGYVIYRRLYNEDDMNKYRIFSKNQFICWLVRKPVGQSQWTDEFIIIDILNKKGN